VASFRNRVKFELKVGLRIVACVLTSFFPSQISEFAVKSDKSSRYRSMSQLLIQQYLNNLRDLRKVSGTHRESVISKGPSVC
jgi:hypothetical protein